jgi:hypothetical protein
MATYRSRLGAAISDRQNVFRKNRETIPFFARKLNIIQSLPVSVEQ